MSFQQYNIYPGLTPVRVVSTSNIAGTYFNGQNNNGVGATLTIAASSLTIDSVVCAVGDRVLLQTQTNTNEQGIYVVLSIGSVVVLQRAADMQSIEQIRAGQFVSVGAGSVEAGNIYSIVEPLPAHFGIDALVINADPSAGGVSFSGGASTANALPVFSNASGDIKAATTTVTLGQALSITGALTASGAIASTAGDITSGSSGNAGNFISFPATAANGTFIFEALNAGGAFDTTVRNSVMGQSSVISIPDPGAATANFLLDAGTNASGTFTEITIANSGLHVLDTNASHDLVITPGSDLTADRILTLTTGDAARTLDISAANVTVSAYGATLVDDAANLNALTTLGIKRGDSDTWGGGGTSFAFTCAGIVATDVVIVSLIAAANNVAVTKCVAGAGTITVDFTADPGAGTIVNFIGLPTV